MRRSCHLLFVAGVVALLLLTLQPAGATELTLQGAAGNGISVDNAPLQAVLDAVPPTGATVRVPAGRYLLNASLRIGSNTRIECADGATFVAARPWTTGERAILVRNRNYGSAEIIDHDIAIANCAFDMTDRGVFHAINFSRARHVLISRVRCRNGGDCVAMVGSDDTTIEHSIATGIRNACWDFWSAPNNATVLGGYCRTKVKGSGLFITGGGGHVPNQVARNFRVEGGIYAIESNSVGIWVMGLGQPGDHDGAANVRITGVQIDLGPEAHPCIKVSGDTNAVEITDFTCSGGRFNAVYVGGGGDYGHQPRNVRLENGLIERPADAMMPEVVRTDGAGTVVQDVRTAVRARRSWDIPPELDSLDR